MSKIPKNCKRKNKILAEGEATGHFHQFTETSQVSCFIEEASQTQYAQVIEPAILDHIEHGQSIIPEGSYKIRRSRELDLVGAVKQVQD